MDMIGKLVFISSPYSHKDGYVVKERYECVCSVAAKLMREGMMTFSPIVYGHSIAQHGDIPTDWKYWGDYCKAILSRCQKMVVVRMPGWEESEGVKEEIKIALEMGIEIEYI